MRRILWAIVILSPFFALAQSDHVSPSSVKQFASAVVLTTSNKIADLVVPLESDDFRSNHAVIRSKI